MNDIIQLHVVHIYIYIYTYIYIYMIICMYDMDMGQNWVAQEVDG